MFDTVVLVDSSFKDYFTTNMIFAKINAEGPDSIVAREYKVSGYPTFVLTDSKGVEVDRIIGYRDADVFVQTVEDYKHGIGTLPAMLELAKDSVDRAMFYEIGDKYKYRGEPENAVVWFNKVIENGVPTDSMSGEARFSLADMKRRNKEYDLAIEDFTGIKKDFTGSAFAEAAQIYIAICYRYQNDTTAAISAFESFVKEFPNSEDTSYALKQIAKLKGEAGN